MRLFSNWIVLTTAVVFFLDDGAAAEPARFWLSTSQSAPSGPSVPTVGGTIGMIQQVHIWAQPATVSNGPYHPLQNRFKTLQNVSLNVVADSAEVGFLGNSPTLHNPALDAVTSRFEFTHDAASGLDAANCSPGVIGICGLQGFSISPTSGFAGIGPVCDANDPFCAMTASGSPAWLIGSVQFEVLQMDAQTNLYLQMGDNGLNHVGESSLFTNVVFGTDTQVLYSAGRDTNADGLIDDHDRNVTLAGDGPDLIVTTSVLPMLPGDYNGNGQVEQGDLDLVLLNWGAIATIPPVGWINDLPLAFIDQAELDGVLLNWGDQSASPGVGAIPEPTSQTLAAWTLLCAGSIALCLRDRR